jgi:hypothetical protein
MDKHSTARHRSSTEGAVLDPAQPVVIDWEPVANPFPGTPSAVSVVGYQVIVEQVNPNLSVFLALLSSPQSHR